MLSFKSQLKVKCSLLKLNFFRSPLSFQNLNTRRFISRKTLIIVQKNPLTNINWQQSDIDFKKSNEETVGETNQQSVYSRKIRIENSYFFYFEAAAKTGTFKVNLSFCRCKSYTYVFHVYKILPFNLL